MLTTTLLLRLLLRVPELPPPSTQISNYQIVITTCKLHPALLLITSSNALFVHIK